MKTFLTNQNPCVLIVDDHEISLQHSVEALRQITNRVKQARCGSEAMEMALDLLPDLILMDINLPDLNGLSVLGQLRQAWPPRRAWPVVVILSGDESSLKSQPANQIEASAVLLKPASHMEIRDTAIRLLQLDQGVQENAVRVQAQTSEPALRKVFLQELEIRIPELDREVTALNWLSANEILHQLIASSAMCSEQNLELQSRLLHKSLTENPQPRSIAQNYYSFLKALDEVRSANPGL